MNILTVDNISKSYGVRKIFDGASFFLQEGEIAGACMGQGARRLADTPYRSSFSCGATQASRV